MAYEQHCASASCNLTHFSQTFFLKLRVTDRQHLVHDEDLWLQMCGYGKGQPNVHAAAVAFHGRVEKPFYLGKAHDLVEFRLDLCPLHAKDRAVEEDVLTTGQLRMETGANF